MTGSFSVLFDKGLAGLDFLKIIGVEVKTRGTISELWADSESPEEIDDNNDTRQLKGRQLEDSQDDTGFDLSQYIAFELRRGDEDSAEPELLDFEVFVDNLEGDKLFFKLKF